MKRLKINLSVLSIALLIFAPACVRESPDIYDPETVRNITVEISVPGPYTPLTRSIEDGKGESAVRTVDLLVFDGKSVPELLRRHRVANIRQSASEPYYKIVFDVEPGILEGAATVAVVANASASVDNAVSQGRIRKPDIMDHLGYNAESDDEGTYKWNVSVPGYTPLPMYGETAVSGVTPGMTLTGIRMVRMLARIDVENKVEGDIFRLEEIYVVNYRAGGFVAPVWSGTTGLLLPESDEKYPYTRNMDPMVPDDAPKSDGTYDSALKYTYTQIGNAPGELMRGEIYTFEESAYNGFHSLRACLVLKGKYKGADNYYRVDFTTDKGGSLGPDEVVYMPLYRNHKYVVTITAAEGTGYGSFEAALQASTVLSNLKTSILVVDMEGLNNIVYDGQYFMGVTSRTVDMPWGINRTYTHRVTSDYNGGWEAKVLDPAECEWLRLAGGGTTSGGTDMNNTGFEIRLTAVPAPSRGGAYPTGKIVFTAGRLCDTLTVRRVPMADMFARSNVILSSGILTFAVNAQDNTTIPAYSQGVIFKWGSLLAVSPSGNPYDPQEHIIFNPTGLDPSGWGSGMSGWDKIPYAHPLFGFMTLNMSGDDADAFKDYNNGIGFNVSAGVGDVCRYISSQPGWVEGEWRTPTYSELLLLYSETGGNEASLGDFENITPDLNSSPSGTSNPASGWFIGFNVTASTPSIGNNARVPPAGVVYLPVSGYRYPNGGGDIVQVGAYGYYASSTPYTDYTVDNIFLGKYGVEFYDADRSYGFPVRCIRDY